ncbi:DMT family transporter [Christiangramia sediminis]|uniref:DMT family transporter n=1 Tax=Christiangramia sediminis TaxID=2881336 RepID=A0A9X1RXP6_9FLAO|nr:EamA family transporter [Christiangramia sediminis]MCB7480590.1 DMT family transporter [Christiangramia sediminis]
MERKAIYAVIICALLAGNNGLLIKSMASMSTGSIAWFRTAVPVLFLIPFLVKDRELHFRGTPKKMLLASFINAIRMYLYLLAFLYTSIGNAVVLFYTYPLFVTAIEYLFFGQKLQKSQTRFLLLAFIGIVITYAGKPFSFASNDFIGMLSAIGASIGYAITVILFKSETQNYSKNQLIFYQNLIGALVFMPFLIGLPGIGLPQIGIGVLYGLLIGIVVFKLFFYGLKELTAATATTLMYLEVVSAIVLGYFILDEKLSWNILAGGATILISSFYISKLNRKKELASST